MFPHLNSHYALLQELRTLCSKTFERAKSNSVEENTQLLRPSIAIKQKLLSIFLESMENLFGSLKKEFANIFQDQVWLL